MKIWMSTFLSVLVVSMVSLSGIIFLRFRKEKLQRIQLILVGLATGSLLGGAFFHLLPEAFQSYSNPLNASFLILSGFMLFFILERFLHWHHDHKSGVSENNIKPFGTINLIADMFHNLLDGILIAAAYTYDFKIGIVTTVIVFMHEFPQEIGDFGVLVHAGFTPKRALFFNFLSACAAFVGAGLIMILNRPVENISRAILPFAAGGFIYLAAADLIPELHNEKGTSRSIIQFIALLTGMACMLLILLFGE